MNIILWKFKEISNQRWAIEFYCNKKYGTQLAYLLQYKLNNKWISSTSKFYGISITKKFDFGSEHIWFDGPHCSFSIGFIHFIKGGSFKDGWCDKCYKNCK